MPAETATTASAASIAVRSQNDDSAYPPPSCSAFHGRNGSREWVVTTCGASWSNLATWPAKLAYHVCECKMSASPVAAAIDRSVDIVSRAGFAPTSSSVGLGRCAKTPGSSRGVAEAVHLDLDESPKLAGEVLDVHSGAAVDLGWVLAGEQRDSHEWQR